jgi:hypothetical protein
MERILLGDAAVGGAKIKRWEFHDKIFHESIEEPLAGGGRAMTAGDARTGRVRWIGLTIMGLMVLLAGGWWVLSNLPEGGPEVEKKPVELAEAVVAQDPKEVFAELAAAWVAARESLAGEEREARYLALCEEAVDALGVSPQMIGFLDFLTENGAPEQREWVLGPGMIRLFSGPRAAEAREAMVVVKDEALRKRMLLQAGRAFGGFGFKEVLDTLTGTEHAACQAMLLAGRCVAVGERDLEAAVAVFRELKVSGMDHSILGEALMVIFKDLDYAGAKKVFRELSDEARHDVYHGLRARQGPTVGPYLAYLDTVIPTGDWAKEEKGLCARLHNLVVRSNEIDVLLDWAVTLPERKDTEDAFRVAMRAMLYREPDRAREWILARNSPWMRNNGLAAYVHAALGVRGDVPGAKWARDRIDDPEFGAAADGWILEYEQRTGKPFPR